MPLTFLSKLHEVLESYIGGPATEASLKACSELFFLQLQLTAAAQDHFDIVLPLLEEMLASGRPLLTSTSQLKELVLPPAKAFANLANAAGCAVLCPLCSTRALTPHLQPRLECRHWYRSHRSCGRILRDRSHLFASSLASRGNQALQQRDLYVHLS